MAKDVLNKTHLDPRSEEILKNALANKPIKQIKEKDSNPLIDRLLITGAISLLTASMSYLIPATSKTELSFTIGSGSINYPLLDFAVGFLLNWGLRWLVWHGFFMIFVDERRMKMFKKWF